MHLTMLQKMSPWLRGQIRLFSHLQTFTYYTVQNVIGICLHIFLLYIKIRAEKGLFVNNIVYSISQCVRKIHQVEWKLNLAFWPGIESIVVEH